MKLLQRYIYREVLLNLVLGIVAINTLLMVEKLIRVAKILSGVAGPMDMVRIMVLIQPQLLIITIPMAYLVSLLLTYGRMNMDNEIVAMASAGIAFREIGVLSLRMGAILLVVSLIVSSLIAPLGSRKLREEVNNLLVSGIPKRMEERTFTDLGNLVIYAEAKEGNLLREVFVYDRKRKTIITARRAFIRADLSGIGMEFRDGLITMRERKRNVEIYFSGYSLQEASGLQSLSRRVEEFTLPELLKRAQESERRIPYMMEFMRRLSYPCMNLVIGLIGPGLALLAGRTGRFGGLTVGILFFSAYYTVSLYLEGLVEAKRLPVEIGMTLPLLAGLLLGMVVFFRSSKR